MMLVLVRVTESSLSPLRFRLINNNTKTFLLILLTYWAVADKWIDVCDLLGSFSAVTRTPLTFLVAQLAFSCSTSYLLRA